MGQADAPLPLAVPPLALIVAGPTASGKSALAVELARRLDGVVINADSMQVYRELRILTARPTPAEEAAVPHALYGVRSAAEPSSAAWWRTAALDAMDAARSAGRLPILCGGTGLYLQALTQGLADIPDPGPAARTEARALLAALGPAALHARLTEADPATASTLRPSDGQRLARAWEVWRGTGQGLATWHAHAPTPPAWTFRMMLLDPPRDTLRDAIEMRFTAMLTAGAVREAAALLALRLDPALPALRAVGMPELGVPSARGADAGGGAAPRRAGLRAVRQAASHLVPAPGHRRPVRHAYDPCAICGQNAIFGKRLVCFNAFHCAKGSGRRIGQCAARPIGSDHMTAIQQQSGAEILLRALRDQGVEVIFGYPGGAVLPIYDAIFQQNSIRHILVRHEQAAVHAAEGYARSTGKVGVVLVTSGPGATNAVTGLVDALMDSIPVVCLTGQVPTHLIGNDAFQEADTTGITRAATKQNYLVRQSQDLARTVHEAFYIARSGRPGPVLIDLPKDILIAPAPYQPASAEPHRSYRPVTEPDPARIKEAVRLLKAAHRPIVYSGGGVINAGEAASDALVAFVRATGVPCTSTLMGLGAYPSNDPQFLGMLGMHGTYEANNAMHGCDVMLNVGARFDDRVTGRINAFSPGSRKIHVDIDPSSINKNVLVDVPVIGDAGRVMEALLAAWHADDTRQDREALAHWWRQIDAWRALDSLKYTQDPTPGAVIKPQHAIRRLYEITRETGRETFISTEVGQHQMWGGAALPLRQAEPLDDLGRSRHHGLRPAGGDGGADRPPRRPGDRHFRGSQRADEHPGDGDAGAVSPAGEGVHPEQPVHGHGAPVAGTAAWRALLRKLLGSLAGLREAGGGLPRRRPARQGH